MQCLRTTRCWCLFQFIRPVQDRQTEDQGLYPRIWKPGVYRGQWLALLTTFGVADLPRLPARIRSASSEAIGTRVSLGTSPLSCNSRYRNAQTRRKDVKLPRSWPASMDS